MRICGICGNDNPDENIVCVDGVWVCGPCLTEYQGVDRPLVPSSQISMFDIFAETLRPDRWGGHRLNADLDAEHDGKLEDRPDLWTRIQLTKTHYEMGALSEQEFIGALGTLYEEAKR